MFQFENFRTCHGEQACAFFGEAVGGRPNLGRNEPDRPG
jgi:hypothetical protein